MHRTAPRRSVARRAFFAALFAALFAVVLVGCGGGGDGGGTRTGRAFPLASLSVAPMTVNGSAIRLWVMDTPAKRSEGFMFVPASEVADDQGMLFVYPDEQFASYFMKDTSIPLDIAFIGADGTVRNTARLIPFDLTSVAGAGPTKYVIEMKQGSFARLGIAEGVRLTLPPVSASQ